MKRYAALYIILLTVACRPATRDPALPVTKTTGIICDSVSANDFTAYSKHLFNGRHKMVLAYYMKKYGSGNCKPLRYAATDLHDAFEGLHYPGDINYNGIADSVFVLGPLNYCAQPAERTGDGQDYYFLDTTLPRLHTDSYCCHPGGLFAVGDIDEDGVQEIGEYYSSCASRYKSLYVYTLKHKQWVQAGHCVYDLLYADTGKAFSSYVRKTGKYRFEMTEITDVGNPAMKGKPNRLTFVVKK